MPKTATAEKNPLLTREEMVEMLNQVRDTLLRTGLAPENKQPPDAETVVNKPNGPSLEEVRTRLPQERLSNKDLDLAALFQKFGAKKLSEVDPKHFAALMAAVEKA